MGITFFAYACEALIAEIFAKKTSIPKIKLPFRALIYIIIFGGMALLHSTNKIWLNIVLDILALITIFAVVFTYKPLKALYYALIMEVVNFMSELLFGNIASHYIDNFWNNWVVARNYFFISLSKALLLFVILIIAKLKVKRTDTPDYNKRDEVIVTLIMICVLAYLTTMSYIAFKSPYSHGIEFLIYISLLLVFIVLFLAIILFRSNERLAVDMMNMHVQLQRNENNLLYARSNEQRDENLRVFVHDIKNHLQTLAYMCKQGENERANQYIEELLKKANLKAAIDISPNKLINSILYRYYIKANTENIDFTFDIRSIDVDFVEDIDITTILCNLMDNAFDGCGDNEPFIEVAMYNATDKNSVVIAVENSCPSVPIVNHLGRFISKKDGKFHGYGIESIRKTAKKYDGDVNMYYDSAEKTFHAVILLNRICNENSDM